jgi:hypothetical protein
MPNCLDCGIQLKDRHKRTKRCIKCSILARTREKCLCIDCKEPIYYYSIRCRKCYLVHCQIKLQKSFNPNKRCIDCGESISRTDSKRCKSCWYIFIKGINNPNYIHGEGNAPYPLEFTDSLKEQIRKRDNYTCQKCGKKGTHIHHIDYNKQNCKENNLITLCNKCNIKANFNINYWLPYYTYLMENK